MAAATPVPLVAIGGILPDSVAALMRAGATGIAAMGSVMRSRDAAGEARALLAAFTQRAR
jgi:thiamine-phosphate pyrophosphorylase